jgi:hypothetical protein
VVKRCPVCGTELLVIDVAGSDVATALLEHAQQEHPEDTSGI